MKAIVIKLGAKGDVLRTIPVVRAIKKKFDCEIVWVTKSNIADLLSGLDFVEEVVSLPYGTSEKFDLLFNFDIEDSATELAEKIGAKKRFGFYKQDGFASAFNLGAEYYLNTLFDDDVKKTNKKTYQEMMFEAAELKYEKENVGIRLTAEDRKYAENFFGKVDTKKLIGIHLGASPRWPSKAWHETRLEEFVKKAKEKGYEILLFGGPDEAERHSKFLQKLSEKGLKILRNDVKNTNRQFAALVNLCAVMVCSDSFALHVALSLKKPSIGLFFCTTPDEVEGYGLLKKVVSPMLYDFFPERMDEYNEELTKSISADQVLKEVELLLKRHNN
jgi:ADP-heptose:LPS heptosyltransferase